LFDVTCQLVRREVPDDVIFAILTDPDFAISKSVLEKGSNAERYAVRQIERAKEEVDDPWLRKLNDRYAVIASIGGKCRVVQEEPDPVLKRSRLIQQSFLDFRNSLMNVSVDVRNATGRMGGRPVGKWWLEHEKRKQFDRIVFLPGKEIPGTYNMWQGFGCQARPGELHQKFLEHIRENVCQGNDEYFRYLISWMARVIQRPAEPGEVAVVLRGGKGVGKSFFAKQFGALFGRHFLQVSNASHLVGNFNAHLRDALLLFADEAFYAGDKKHASILKTLITEETIQIEAKGVDVETAPNFVHLIMASNDDHVIPASGDERRFFVLDVGIQHQQKAQYFKAIAEDLENGGYENLLYFLMTFDIGDFEVRHVPQTSALLDQKQSSLEGIDRLVFEMLGRGELPFVTKWIGDERSEDLRAFLATGRLQEWAQEYLRRGVTDKRIGDLLCSLGSVPAREKGSRGWVFPLLNEARSTWSTTKFKVDWDEASRWVFAPYPPADSSSPF
jgi:Family of unknown function (DUF5906)